MKNNALICGDSLYEIDKPYREGALAMRRQVPWTNNPYQHGCGEYDQWSYGHENESDDQHTRLGVDVITTTMNGRVFRDANVEMIKADPNGLAALALSGALPDKQAGEILASVFGKAGKQPEEVMRCGDCMAMVGQQHSENCGLGRGVVLEAETSKFGSSEPQEMVITQAYKVALVQAALEAAATFSDSPLPGLAYVRFPDHSECARGIRAIDKQAIIDAITKGQR